MSRGRGHFYTTPCPLCGTHGLSRISRVVHAVTTRHAGQDAPQLRPVRIWWKRQESNLHECPDPKSGGFPLAHTSVPHVLAEDVNAVLGLYDERSIAFHCTLDRTGAENAIFGLAIPVCDIVQKHSAAATDGHWRYCAADSQRIPSIRPCFASLHTQNIFNNQITSSVHKWWRRRESNPHGCPSDFKFDTYANSATSPHYCWSIIFQRKVRSTGTFPSSSSANRLSKSCTVCPSGLKVTGESRSHFMSSAHKSG